MSVVPPLHSSTAVQWARDAAITERAAAGFSFVATEWGRSADAVGGEDGDAVEVDSLDGGSSEEGDGGGGEDGALPARRSARRSSPHELPPPPAHAPASWQPPDAAAAAAAGGGGAGGSGDPSDDARLDALIARVLDHHRQSFTLPRSAQLGLLDASDGDGVGGQKLLPPGWRPVGAGAAQQQQPPLQRQHAPGAVGGGGSPAAVDPVLAALLRSASVAFPVVASVGASAVG
jgi:hypothetical protein